MKKIVLICLASSFLFACENSASKKVKETSEGISNTMKVTEELNKMGNDLKELQKATPLTNEEMKAWLPDEINGMKRIGYKAGQTAYVKIASIEATYNNEDKSKIFKIQVLDGAGEMGAAATASIRMMLSMDMEEENESKTKRTVTKNGIKALEEYQKNNNNTNIQLLYDERFFVQATGTNMDIDQTWDAIEELDLDDLE